MKRKHTSKSKEREGKRRGKEEKKVDRKSLVISRISELYQPSFCSFHLFTQLTNYLSPLPTVNAINHPIQTLLDREVHVRVRLQRARVRVTWDVAVCMGVCCMG